MAHNRFPLHLQPQQDADQSLSEDPPTPNLLGHMLKQLKPGQDLSRVLIPAFFLEPRSILEKYTDLMMHPQLLYGLHEEQDPLQRMVRVVKWFLSGWHYRPNRPKKPYNSIIGETFSCFWDGGEHGISEYFAEQVSHHPPVSALYFENRKQNIVFNAEVRARSKFLGNSAASMMEGFSTLYLLNLNERYGITFPTFVVGGLFMGRLRMELTGTCTIYSMETGYTAEIKFLEKPSMSGENKMNRVHAVIQNSSEIFYEINGKWSDEMSITNKKTGVTEPFLNVNTLPVIRKWVVPTEQQSSYDSRKLWKDVTAELIQSNPDWSEVDRRKAVLEDAQRELPIHNRRIEGATWNTKKFHKRSVINPITGQEAEQWTFDDMHLEPYQEGEDLRTFVHISQAFEWEGVPGAESTNTSPYYNFGESKDEHEPTKSDEIISQENVGVIDEGKSEEKGDEKGETVENKEGVENEDESKDADKQENEVNPNELKPTPNDNSSESTSAISGSVSLRQNSEVVEQHPEIPSDKLNNPSETPNNSKAEPISISESLPNGQKTQIKESKDANTQTDPIPRACCLLM